MSLPWKHAIVVGASSGIGKALAEELLKQGVSVAMIARRNEEMERIAQASPKAAGVKALVYPHDVLNYDATPALFQEITHDLGGLDLIIYASGVMPSIDEHEYNFTKDRAMLEVNTIAAFAWLNEAAKRFEQTKHGTIVGISSIAGERGRRAQAAPGFARNSFFGADRAHGIHCVALLATVGAAASPVGRGRHRFISAR